MQGTPRQVIDADEFIIAVLFKADTFNPYDFCHRPMIITNTETTLEDVLSGLHVVSEHAEDDVIDKDIIIVWA